MPLLLTAPSLPPCPATCSPDGDLAATAGLALGVMMSRCTRVREDMVIEAAKAVARDVSDEDRQGGALLPQVAAMRDVAGALAALPACCCCTAVSAAKMPCW
jgi:malate dehydrogenase (oxaloacetate-decarboxylating)(NADP+)